MDELRVKPGKSWTYNDLTEMLKRGRFRGLQRCHSMLCEVLETIFGKTDYDPVVAALPEMVKGSLERVDVDVRKDLLLNIVLSGGGSCAPGTAERLHSDVALSLCAPFKAKIVAPAAFERKFGVWIGGSILSSLGSFQQMWLSKKEYDDDGPTRLVEGRWD